MQARHFNIFPIILLALLVFLQYKLWFDVGGVIDIVRLKKRVSIEQVVNDKMKKRNEMLALQVKNLQTNQDAIESRARQELGMIKKGETFYQVVK